MYRKALSDLLGKPKPINQVNEQEEYQLAIKLFLMESAAQAILDEIPFEDRMGSMKVQMNESQQAKEDLRKDLQVNDSQRQWEGLLMQEIYDNEQEELASDVDQSHQSDSEVENLRNQINEQLLVKKIIPPMSQEQKSVVPHQFSNEHQIWKQVTSLTINNKLKRIQSDTCVQPDIALVDFIKTRKFHKIQ